MNIGRFEIKKQIGQGGMGKVLLGYDPMLQRDVAIKVMQAGGQSSEDVQRFLREAQTVSKLNHPGIVAVYEMGQENGQLYLAMELVEGTSFKQLLTPGTVPPEAVLRRNLLLFRQVLEAIASAHEHSVVHRDLKPDNIMVTCAGQAKVLDFGLAFVAGNHNLTMTGDVGMGTPNYVAPEQIKDFAHTDLRADIYSLGVILYELLTGRCPLEAPNTVALIYKVVSEEPKKPSEINGTLSPELDSLVMRTLRKNPDERFQSVREMLAEFDAACHLTAREIAASSPVQAKTNTAAQFPKLTVVGVPLEAAAKCPHCGFSNRNGYKFCNNCGRPAGQICPHCGNTANREGATFCNACGQPLRPAVGTPAKELLRGVLDQPAPSEPQPTYMRFHRDYVRLGHYPQHDASFAEPIEWMVLDRDASRRRMLLISRYGLDCGRYYSLRRGYDTTVDWESCTLRRWLDEEFLEQAFDESERAMLLPVQFGRNDALSFGRTKGDRVFLLSINEAEKYFIDDMERCCQPTEYAISEGAYSSRPGSSEGYGWWWLRSAGTNEDCAACIHDGGAINDRGQEVWNTDLCIRPAIYVSLK